MRAVMRLHVGFCVLFLPLVVPLARGADAPRESINSIGMTLVRIEPGSFDMGADSLPLPPELTRGLSGVSWDRPDGNGDYDEVPVHRVTITKPLLIGQSEVTVEQFRNFRPDYQPASSYWSPCAAGVSWNDASAFCQWLSAKEGKPYRLPTEAEWEFICRAGSRRAFAAGDGAKPDEAGIANRWGVKNMQAAVPEWCFDWWARYPREAQTDPIGPATGTAKVVRGGALDYRPNPKADAGKRLPAESPYYRRSANRACAAPDFSSAEGHIGFRIVQAEMPDTPPLIPHPNFFSTAIKQDTPDLKAGPDPAKPYYRTRELFPRLGEHNMRSIGWKIGLARGLGQAYHNSAVQMCPNGDLIAAYYNTLQWEDEIDQSILTMRLRYGSDEWDMPEPWPDFTDAADAAPVFWNDGAGKMWFFWGSPRMLAAPPFQFMTSTDSGATWTAAQTPRFTAPIGTFTPQPVNSVTKDRDETIYLAVDGKAAETALFATSDNGKSWRDTGGRTAGRHTSFVLGKDGSLIGYGGKNSNIDGFMPKSITRDGGKTYTNSATEFKPLAGGQRPSIIRLASGRMFFVADTLSSRVPGGRNASFVALSDDEGQTWTRRELPIKSTCGYVTAMQTPNGVIHIVTSKTKPAAVHIELNETWVLQGGDPTPQPTNVRDVHAEKTATAQWSGGIADDGNYRLDGTQTFFYDNGKKRWESTYAAGRKIGTETFWDRDGHKEWERIFDNVDGWTWRVFDHDGMLRAESTWKGKVLIDPAPQPKSADARLIPPETVKRYVDAFNRADPEPIVNMIPNFRAAQWITQQVPLFECPDKDLEKVYYFRWWTFRKHIRRDDGFLCLSEFLARNPISSAVGHHVMEGRWIRDPAYLDQNLLYWLHGRDGKPHDPQNFSSWTVWSAYQRYLVNGEKAFIVSLLDDFVRDYQGWESKRRAPDGTYWQFESRDAMEDSINGDRRAENRRPSISSYMYGNATAIAAVARLAGRDDLAAEYSAKATAIKTAVQQQLWDPQAKFFKVRWRDGPLSDAREAIGFIPWYFELPDRGYEEAWLQLIDTRGFSAPFGLTTAERRHPRFRTHGSGHSCEWDGAVWPFATSQTLTAMANLLNNYPQDYVSKDDYLRALQTYARSHQLDGQPYIGEYLDETTGQWLRDDKERGRHYNHSTFCDLIITGLVGLRPRADATIQINPLVPASAAWDYFCLDNIPYHGHRLSIIWDRTGQHYHKQSGLTLLQDGRPIAHRPALGPLFVDIARL